MELSVILHRPWGRDRQHELTTTQPQLLQPPQLAPSRCILLPPLGLRALPTLYAFARGHKFSVTPFAMDIPMKFVASIKADQVV